MSAKPNPDAVRTPSGFGAFGARTADLRMGRHASLSSASYDPAEPACIA